MCAPVSRGLVPNEYLSQRHTDVVQPVLRLAAFERVTLKPGSTTKVVFDLEPQALAVIDPRMKRAVQPGVVEIAVGPSSAKPDSVELTIDAPARPPVRRKR